MMKLFLKRTVVKLSKGTLVALLVLSQLLFPGMSNFSMAQAANTGTSGLNFATYVLPAITDTKILPKMVISSSRLSDTISAQASLGEYKALTFVVRSNQAISSLRVEASDLAGNGTKKISSSAVDIRAVKCWYQGGYLTNTNHFEGRFLTPELLLKDDSLVKVVGDDWDKYNVSNPQGKNYLKLTNGTYIDISKEPEKKDAQMDITSIAERPVKDAAVLQPINLPADYNKQFWITLHVPENAAVGFYNGTITFKAGSTIIKSLNLKLTVLPITLPDPDMEYGIYYNGTITKDGSISSEYKTVEQYTAEHRDMREHGVVKPTIKGVIGTGKDDILRQELSIRKQTGIDNTDLYYVGNIKNFKPSIIPTYKKLAASYGTKELYVYGWDEESIDNERKEKVKAIHDAGGKFFVSQNPTQAGSVAEILDLAIISQTPASSLAAKYRGYGHKVYVYGIPQTVPEYPRLYRMNYGLLLWQRGYNGAMPYAYQHSMGDIWNDFDYQNGTALYRDHCFTYPTMNGVVDTIQWEGFREGVNDLRYVAALQDSIDAAKKQGKGDLAAEAKNYLDELKTVSLADADLDAIRSRIIGFILSLSSTKSVTTHSLTVTSGKGSGFYAPGTQVKIVAGTTRQDGLVFDKWTGDIQYLSSPDDVNSANATVTMPDQAISLSAVYRGPWYDSGYAYRKAITIDHDKVAGTSAFNSFPLLVSFTDPSLKSRSNGGNLHKLAYDLVFTLPDKTVLPYEIEVYDNTRGRLVAWVKLPVLYGSTDTVVYMYYGNPKINTSQQNKFAVWNSNFQGVWHMAEKEAAQNRQDATHNANHSMNTAAKPAVVRGQIDKAQSFNGSNYLNFGNAACLTPSKLTLSFWMKLEDNGQKQIIINKGDVYSVEEQKGYEVMYTPDDKNLNFWVKGTSGRALARYKFTEFGKWVYITAVTESGSISKLYENGVLKARTAIVTTDFSNDYYLYIGTRQTLAKQQRFNGSLDELRIINTVRSPEWIQTEYNNQSSPSTFFTLGEEESYK